MIYILYHSQSYFAFLKAILCICPLSPVICISGISSTLQDSVCKSCNSLHCPASSSYSLPASLWEISWNSCPSHPGKVSTDSEQCVNIKQNHKPQTVLGFLYLKYILCVVSLVFSVDNHGTPSESHFPCLTQLPRPDHWALQPGTVVLLPCVFFTFFLQYWIMVDIIWLF